MKRKANAPRLHIYLKVVAKYESNYVRDYSSSKNFFVQYKYQIEKCRRYPLQHQIRISSNVC